jgi:tRNA (cytidine/uridine-2'-O-)-methyltransferase
MHVVLLEPEIPPNTGNIARLCAGMGATLHLIEPLGFSLDERRLQRAGMDYWKWVEWRLWPDWVRFRESLPPGARLWFVEQGAPRGYHQVRYEADDYLVFGRETAGLPRRLLEASPDGWIDLPMRRPEARSLNLANCVAVVLFEALRQQGFPPLELPPVDAPHS